MGRATAPRWEDPRGLTPGTHTKTSRRPQRNSLGSIASIAIAFRIFKLVPWGSETLECRTVPPFGPLWPSPLLQKALMQDNALWKPDGEVGAGGTSLAPIIYVIDDDEPVLQSIIAVLEGQGFVTRGFLKAADFLSQLDPQSHGCIVTDWRMPDLSGMQLLEELRARAVPLPVIVLTAYADVPMAVGAMRTGAVTVLQKPCPDAELLAAIQQAVEADQANHLQNRQREDIRRRIERLSDGERKVMDLALSGKMNREIASELGIGLRTVEKRRHNVMEKMQVESLAELMQVMMIVESAPAL